MPIKFTICAREGYYIAEFIGRITDDEMLADYSEFFEGDAWSPELNELADLSKADASEVTSLGINKLVEMIEGLSKRHNCIPRVAVYAPHDLLYGLSRMFSFKVERFVFHRVFRNLDEAKAWLCGPSE